MSATETGLRSFTLDDLAQYTAEGAFGPGDSPDFRVFQVGRDDVHGVLLHLLSRVQLSLKGTMYGYDDPDLNAAIMNAVKNPQVLVQFTLDKSQAGGKTEKALLTADAALDPEKFTADFAVGQSETHQIIHTKGFVADGVVGVEGSTNWSAGGEGVGIGLRGAANVPGFKAQENTLTVFTNQYEIARFAARLDYAHAVAKRQQAATPVAA